MNNSLFYILFVVFTVILITLPFTSAPWYQGRSPVTPHPFEKRLCFEWIIFNGFDADNVGYNQLMALNNRDPELDPKAFLWSVGYAYLMSGFNISNFKPLEFCANRGVPNIPMQFWPLQSTARTCKGWIFLYGYDVNEHYIQNWEKARFRNFTSDNYISHWVAAYGQHLSALSAQGHNIDAVISPDIFCSGLGLNVNEVLPFMTRITPILSCEKWIMIHGFTDDPRTNFNKAQVGFNMDFKDQIHYWAKQYATDILSAGRNFNMKPRKYCRINSMDYRTPIAFYATLEVQ